MLPHLHPSLRAACKFALFAKRNKILAYRQDRADSCVHRDSDNAFWIFAFADKVADDVFHSLAKVARMLKAKVAVKRRAVGEVIGHYRVRVRHHRLGANPPVGGVDKDPSAGKRAEIKTYRVFFHFYSLASLYIRSNANSRSSVEQ